MHEPFFIVGCPRSGTTLLRSLLRAHSRLCIPGETHFIPQFWLAYGDPANGAEAARLAARILRLPRVASWETGLTPADFADVRSYSALIDRLFGAVAAQEGKMRWGDKTPHYVRYIPQLAALFPGSRFIHVYRDGRDVALSWLKARIEPGNLYKAASFWAGWVRQGRADGARQPLGSYLEVRYETLLASPETTLRRICEFLGEEFEPAVLAPQWAQSLQVHQPLFGHREAGVISTTQIVPENHDKWRTAMTRKQRALFESAAGDLLAELGYETEGLARRLPAAERFFWDLHHLGAWGLERLNTRDLHKHVAAFAVTQWAQWKGHRSPAGHSGQDRREPDERAAPTR